MHLIDSNIVFYDSNNKLYNDICYTFTSNHNTDMTIEDRINEYLLKLSLCETNCSLINIVNKEEYQNPRSLCNCKIKNNIIISNDNYSFINERNEVKKVLNINALKCSKEVFSSKKIAKNYIFWVFLIVLVILLIILIKIIFYSKNTLERLIETENEKYNNFSNNKTCSNLINDFDKNYKNNLNIRENRSQNVLENSKTSDLNIDDYDRKIYKTQLSDSEPPKRKKNV